MDSKQNTSKFGVATDKIYSQKYVIKDNGPQRPIVMSSDSHSINGGHSVNGLGCKGKCLFTDCFENVHSIQISDPGFLENRVPKIEINGIGGIGGSSYEECFKNTDSIDIKGPPHEDGPKVPFSLSVTSEEKQNPKESNNPQKCLNGIGGIGGAVNFSKCFRTDAKKPKPASIVISSSSSSKNGSKKRVGTGIQGVGSKRRVVTGIQGVGAHTNYDGCFIGQKSIMVAGRDRGKGPGSSENIGEMLSFKDCFKSRSNDI